MGVRNRKRETLKRLDSKTLDSRFLNEIKIGLNCSPFEAEAVLEKIAFGSKFDYSNKCFGISLQRQIFCQIVKTV